MSSITKKEKTIDEKISAEKRKSTIALSISLIAGLIVLRNAVAVLAPNIDYQYLRNIPDIVQYSSKLMVLSSVGGKVDNVGLYKMIVNSPAFLMIFVSGFSFRVFQDSRFRKSSLIIDKKLGGK